MILHDIESIAAEKARKFFLANRVILFSKKAVILKITAS